MKNINYANIINNVSNVNNSDLDSQVPNFDQAQSIHESQLDYSIPDTAISGSQYSDDGVQNNNKNKNRSKDRENIDDKDDNDGKDSKNDKNEEKLDPNFIEAVTKYMIYDNLLRRKREECKILGKEKIPHQKFIIEFLKGKNETFVNTGTGKLVRHISSRKASLSPDIIKKSIYNTLLPIFNDEAKTYQIIELIVEAMDKNRSIVQSDTLKRTFKKPPKSKH